MKCITCAGAGIFRPIRGTVTILGTNGIPQLIKMYGKTCEGPSHENHNSPGLLSSNIPIARQQAPKIFGQGIAG